MTMENVPAEVTNEDLLKAIKTPTVWASIGTTINMGNYENQKVDFGLSGIPVGASPEFIQEQLGKATLTLQQIIQGLAVEMGRIMTENYGR